MKIKELKKLSKTERENKMKELKLELIKSQGNTLKTGNSKTRQIKKIIARLLTLNASEKEVLKK